MNTRSLPVRTWRNLSWLAILGLWLGPAVVWGADWPQWRYDAGRSAASPAELPGELQLAWIRHLPQPQPAWPESQPCLRYDVSYSPVAAGKLLLVPSMVTDSVTAYETDTGVERWRFVTDGPVRFAPIAQQGRVYLGSDDGYLYCLTADEGKLLWRFRGGPSDRKVLGNQRLISTWPVRGGPVLLGNTVYFTAGIWPFMGIFLHAVDAETGEAVWTNSGDSCPFTIQPHKSPAFGGFVPQGHLAATDAGLVAPGGRTPPASYDLKTGRQLQWVWTQKGGGTCDVTARDQWFFAGVGLWQIADGVGVQLGAAAVHDESGFYNLSSKELTADGFQMVETPVAKAADRPEGKADGGGPSVKTTRRTLQSLWRLPVDEDCGRLFLKAGSRFYAGKQGGLTALEADPQAGKTKVVWKQAIEGTPWTMLAADDKLFVVTVEGDLYCYGGAAASTVYERPASQPAAELRERWVRDAARILQETKVDGGYVLVLGLGSGRLTEALARTPNLRVIVLDPDAQKISDFRRRMIETGLYGTHVTAHVSQPDEDPLPPYLASLIVSENPQSFGIDRGKNWMSIFRKLRPYGGTAYLPLTADRLNQQIRLLQLPGAEVRSSSTDAAMLIRTGGLPGASDWTHQYADGANTVVSQDDLVKAPLGLLWFGGPPNDEVLPRHGHGPSPQVAAGRLFIEGPDMLRALDIYTGRLLWQVSLLKLGKYYDNTSHQPGANEIGSNYVSLSDAVYVVYGSSILKLDAATGKQLQEIKLDATPENSSPRWGYIGAYEDLLVATSTPVNVEQEKATTKTPADSEVKTPPSSPPPSIAELLLPADYASGSRRLVVMDRTTGKVLWDRQATYTFRHNNIALGAGKLFAIDGLSAMKQQALVRRGIDPAQFPAKLLALDLRTGKEIWSTQENVLGTFLNYSAEHDILLQAGSAARDRAPDETRTGMIAYRGSDGSVLWKDLAREHSGPCMLHDDTIITQNTAYNLLNGELKLREHPLTGEPIPWEYKRNYGCNTVIASQHLLTFRSAAAGFLDLDRDGGTGNLGGFKSSCTSNLIPAGGLLNAPEYTRTCICNYQNQTSLAMVHDPSVEMWTFNDLAWSGKPVRRVGINFGAPGDRRGEDGTLWLDWPSLGGPSPDLPLEFEPKDVETFRYHSSLVLAKPGSGTLSWVSASGVEGIRRVELTLSKEPAPARPYTVRLHFIEPEAREAGQRVFRVRLQGQEVLAKLDIFEEAGRMTALVKPFPAISATDKLVIEFDPTASDAKLPPLVCGIEVVAE